MQYYPVQYHAENHTCIAFFIVARSAGDNFLGGMVLDLRCKQDTAGHGVVHDAVLARRGAPEKKNRVPESLQIPYNFLLKTNEKCAQPAKAHDEGLRNSRPGSAGLAFQYCTLCDALRFLTETPCICNIKCI